MIDKLRNDYTNCTFRRFASQDLGLKR